MTISTAYQQLLYRLYELYDNREAANIADLVIEKVTGQGKIDRIIYKNIPLSLAQQEELALYTAKLLHHIPVQYVLHETWFAGMKFFVDENVLIPRPETDELVSEVVAAFQSSNIVTHTAILDIGSGSGCIPIALKKKLPKAVVTSVDISEGALQIAQKNAASLDAEITFIQLDFLDESQWHKLDMYDIIVSNPPYVKQSESKDMSQHVTAFEPALALFVPDNDALIFYKKIALFAKKHLNPGGKIFVEINEALGSETVALFTAFGFTAVLKKDLQEKDRMIICSEGAQVSIKAFTA